MVLKIAFHSEILDIRGSCVAIYDYAVYNEKLLGNISVIVVPISSIERNRNDDIAVTKFMERFPVYFYKDKEDMENYISDCDIFYIIKFGKNDGLFSNRIKTVVHCVFEMLEPHGQVYAAVSEQIAKKYNQTLYVPHMIGLEPSITKENLRKQLNISDDSLVFSRYGGYDTFNIEFCYKVIEKIVNERKDIYFLFINTPIFCKEHPNIIHLPKIVSNEDKNKFICTSDAHLECSNFGQSMGLAIGEYSINNKPIICYDGWTWNQSHLQILGNKAIKFKTEDEFYNILTNFNPKEYLDKDMNCYKEFSPDKVIKKFKEVFID
jgi:hypothetical protein